MTTLVDVTRSAHRTAPDDVVVLTPLIGGGRAARRRWRHLLRETWCRGRRPCMVGSPAPGTTLVVLQWPGADERFIGLVGTVHHRWDLQTTVVGTVEAVGHRLPPDVMTSAGAASLSRSLKPLLGHRPEWEVQHAKTPITAARLYLERHPPGIVAIPHAPHHPRARCQALDLAYGTRLPMLLA